MQQLKFLDKNVGILTEDKVFVGHRYSQHIFYKFKGLGMSVHLLMNLRSVGCRKIVLLLHKDNEVEKYEATPEQFLDDGIPWRDKAFDYQRILPFKMLNQTRLNPHTPSLLME